MTREDYDNLLEYGMIDEAQIYVSELEATIEAQEIIIKDKTAIIDAMAQPKTCDGCKWDGSKYGDWSEHCGNCCRNVIQEDDMYKLKAE